METPPHVLAFIEAQTANLPLYATQGAALIDSYLSAQPRQGALVDGSSRARSRSSGLAVDDRQDDDGRQQKQQLEPPSSPPAPHPLLGAGGVSGVDVLNAARAAEPRSSANVKIVPGPAAPPAGRLVHRMKGRDGAVAGSKVVIKTSLKVAALQSSTAAAKVVASEQPVVDAAARAREGSVIQTRAELRRARGGQAADVGDEGAAVRVEAAVEGKHRRSTSDRPKVDTKASASTPAKVHGASHANDVLGDDSVEIQRAALLAERRQRRRAKAAIVKPKQPAVTDSEGSVIIVGGSSDDDDDNSETTRRPIKRSRPTIDAGAVAKRAAKDVRGSTAVRKRAASGDTRKTAAPARESRRLGLGPLDTFKATNVVDGRLTLRRRDGARPGVFNKGVASSKVAPKKGARVRGVPDLVFSERDFLDRARPTSTKSRLRSLSPADAHGSPSSSSSTTTSSSAQPAPARRRPALTTTSAPADSTKVRQVVERQKKTLVTVAAPAPQTVQPAAVSRYFRFAKSNGNGHDGGVAQKIAEKATTPRRSPPDNVSMEADGSRPYSPSWPDSDEAEAEVQKRDDVVERPASSDRHLTSPAVLGEQRSAVSPRSQSPMFDRASSPVNPPAAKSPRARSIDRKPNLDVEALLYLPPTLTLRPTAADADSLLDERAAATDDNALQQWLAAGVADTDASHIPAGPPSDCKDTLPPFVALRDDDFEPMQSDGFFVDDNWQMNDPIDVCQPLDDHTTGNFDASLFSVALGATNDILPAPAAYNGPTLDARGLASFVDDQAATEAASWGRFSRDGRGDQFLVDPTNRGLIYHSLPLDVDNSFSSTPASEGTSDGGTTDGGDDDDDDPLDLHGSSTADDALDLALARHWQPHRT